jgi:hypothetical protein
MEEGARGRRIHIFGGNDAHGNFNRFRQVKLPMLFLHENDRNLFGRITTRVKSKSLDKSGIVNALKSGCAVISDGPVLDISVVADNHETVIGGTALQTAESCIRIRWASSPEFGAVETICLFTCNNNQSETILWKSDQNTAKTDPYSGSIDIPFVGRSYIRGELICHRTDGSKRFSVTNPIWIHKD